MAIDRAWAREDKEERCWWLLLVGTLVDVLRGEAGRYIYMHVGARGRRKRDQVSLGASWETKMWV